MHPVRYDAHHRLQQQQQQFMADDNDSSSASDFFVSNPQQQQQQSVLPYPLHSQQRQHSGPVTHQLFQEQFQPFQQQQQQQPFSAVNFRLGLNENSGGKEVALPLNHRQNDATFWKPLNKVSQSTSERSKNLENKYRLFGELEAIYGLEAGSGSALTVENSPPNVGISMPLTEFQGHNNVGSSGGVGHGYSETTSIEKEASLRKKIHKKRRMKIKEESSLSSIAVFLESLVKQVSDHQECLRKRFLEIIERMDEERLVKEESWRRQEVERRNREAVARAHEQALASSREALIVSYLEKITGESINLPQRTPLLLQPESAIAKADNNNSRWPIAEVEALIQVRCNLEPKFQEPGLKGPLWEEVSCFMSSSGYQRSAKRCKEKWENINKFFRKSKGNGKKRSRQSKTCSYFDQLDQLYSRVPINNETDMQMQGDSDLEAQESHGNDLENDGGEREDDDNDNDEAE